MNEKDKIGLMANRIRECMMKHLNNRWREEIRFCGDILEETKICEKEQTVPIFHIDMLKSVYDAAKTNYDTSAKIADETFPGGVFPEGLMEENLKELKQILLETDKRLRELARQNGFTFND